MLILSEVSRFPLPLAVAVAAAEAVAAVNRPRFRFRSQITMNIRRGQQRTIRSVPFRSDPIRSFATGSSAPVFI